MYRLREVLRFRNKLNHRFTLKWLGPRLVMQHTLEDIFLELNFFFKLSHFTAESQKWLFKFVSIVYDFEWHDLAGLLFEFNQT